MREGVQQTFVIPVTSRDAQRYVCLRLVMRKVLFQISYTNVTSARKSTKRVNICSGTSGRHMQKRDRRCSSAFSAGSSIQINRRSGTIWRRTTVCVPTGSCVRSSVSEKLQECDQCEKKCKGRAALHYHKRTAHADAGHFECDECDKLCPNKRALNDHKRRVHSDFECPICGKKMRQGSSSVHMKAHAGEDLAAKNTLICSSQCVSLEQQCECDVCGTTHRNSSALALHKQRAHSKAQHRCDHCGKVFSWASALQKHTTIHNGRCLLFGQTDVDTRGFGNN